MEWSKRCYFNLNVLCMCDLQRTSRVCYKLRTRKALASNFDGIYFVKTLSMFSFHMTRKRVGVKIN